MVPRTVLGLASCRLATKATEPLERSSVQPVSARAPSRTSCSVYPPARPRVNSSMNSRERFSLGALTVFCWPSSQNRRAGSTTIDSARSVKVPRPLARRVAFCASSIACGPHLGRRRREVVVPAEGELLDERVLHGDHPADPPRGEVGRPGRRPACGAAASAPSRRPDGSGGSASNVGGGAAAAPGSDSGAARSDACSHADGPAAATASTRSPEAPKPVDRTRWAAADQPADDVMRPPWRRRVRAVFGAVYGWVRVPGQAPGSGVLGRGRRAAASGW